MNKKQIMDVINEAINDLTAGKGKYLVQLRTDVADYGNTIDGKHSTNYRVITLKLQNKKTVAIETLLINHEYGYKVSSVRNVVNLTNAAKSVHGYMGWRHKKITLLKSNFN